MASPTVVNVSSGSFVSATLWSLPIPTNAVIGDLLVAIVRTGTTPVVTGMSGAASWTQLMSDATDATDDNTYVYYGKITTLAGSIAISVASACKGSAVIYAIRGAADPATQAPNVSSRQIFTTAANAGNPPAIALAGGAKDYLFIAALALGGTAGASDIPTGYNGQYFFGSNSTGGSAATNCGVYAVTKAATVGTSEDPSAFTHGAANLGGCAFTIAIHPAGPTTYFGVVSRAITFGKAVSAQPQTRFGSVDLSLAFSSYVNGIKKPALSSLSMPITFGKQVRGRTGKNYHDEVLADSPFIYWRMDEAGVPQDYSGNGLHMTSIDSGVTQVPGLIPFDPTSMAKGFTGTAMNRGSPTFYQNTMSFEVWLQRARTDTYEVLIDQYNSGWEIIILANGTIEVRRSYGPGIAYSSRIKILDTLPHHLVITRDFSTGEVIFYLDDQVPESVIGTLWDHGAPANYACFVGSQWGAYTFQGTMDEMALYSYVLSPNQIAYHRTTGLRQAAKTLFSATSLSISFNKEVSGTRKTFGKTNAPFTFGKAVAGARTTFSSIASPITFGIATSGIRVGLIHYGQIALPITFSKDVRGQRKAFGRVALPITFAKEVNGRRTTFGKLDLQIVGGQYVRGIIHAYSQTSMQTLFGKETAGQRKTFGQVALPLIFSKDVRGKRKTFGRVALPIVFDSNTIAQRQTFGQITAPFIFDSAIQGRRTVFGKLALPMNLRFMVGEAHLGVHGEISLPVIVGFDTSGTVIRVGVILNNAQMIYLGTEIVQAVYVDDQKVWPMT